MTNTSRIHTGNAELESQATRGWIVGHFMPESDIRKSHDVEVKWGLHEAGDARQNWVTGEHRTTIFILISGRFRIYFRDQSVTLEKRGDYVMWGLGVDHRWECLEDAVGVTVRWPSAP